MSSPLDEQALHQERAELILALNGNPVNAEMGWQIIHRWDALVNVAKAAEPIAESVPRGLAVGKDELWALVEAYEALAELNKEPA